MAEKVRIEKARYGACWYADKIGEVFNVTQSRHFLHDYKVIKGEHYAGRLIDKGDVSIVHEIDGVLYKEVERKAEVGEKVIITSAERKFAQLGWYRNGDVFTVLRGDNISSDCVIVNGSYYDDSEFSLAADEYRVLEPVDVTPSTPTDDLLEITANLTRRVFDLERENKQLRDDVTETLGTITDLLRRRDRRIEEIERKVFDTSALKTYSLAELNGKKVTLLHGKDGDYEVLTAKDEDGSFYVISEKVGLR